VYFCDPHAPRQRGSNKNTNVGRHPHVGADRDAMADGVPTAATAPSHMPPRPPHRRYPPRETRREGDGAHHVAINGPEHWPRVLIINRPFAEERRNKLMRARKLATRPGEDRDEYPPATLRGLGAGLERGRNPTGWEADLFRVPSRQNRLAGNIQSNTTGPYCDGQRVEFTWP
jgi:hypothetical protein